MSPFFAVRGCMAGMGAKMRGRQLRSITTRQILAILLGVLLCSGLLMGLAPRAAFAESNGDSTAQAEPVDISADGDAARMEGCAYAVADFYRAQVGSNRAFDDGYHGYSYQVDSPDLLVAINSGLGVVVYVPASWCAEFDIDLTREADQQTLKDFLIPLDAGQAQGNVRISADDPWYFTSEPSLTVEGVVFSFGQELREGRSYATIIGSNGEDVTDVVKPGNIDSCRLVPADEAHIAAEPTALESLGTFLSTMDYSPLWVTLKTTGVAIIFIFILGLAAAYFTMRISKRAQDIFDTIFTIPMVLPPTVCGFLLLMLLGRNTGFGQWFIDIGFPLIFSWQATVIAAVVVAFPLMYRSARGAFENLDPNMMDAARTLGWSNAKIFFRLMMPLAWSSIAAGTVLAFARALGEFGCTLFLAGNQIGITRTIPIAIYYEWMGGNQAATWFWTIVLLVFSFIVILFINLWSRHTTKYRERATVSKGQVARGRKARREAKTAQAVSQESGEVS